MDINARQYFVVANDQFLCSPSGDLIVLKENEFSFLNIQINVQLFITANKYEEFLVVATCQKEIAGYQWLSLRSQLGLISDDRFQLAGRALQTLRWHLDHQYCGRCGKPTVHHQKDLARTCTYCLLDFYPRLSPCVIVLVTRDDYCLLAHHTKSSSQIFSCLAGFIEIGESPEQTIVREVMEEVSVNVNNIRYMASQPWPFPGQLMLGYFADFMSGDIMVDQNEIIAAAWYHYNQLPNVPPAATISGRLINAFVQQRRALHNNIK
jgi:NAD+ diphosphatase